MYQLYNIDEDTKVFEGSLKQVVQACSYYESLGYNMAICKGLKRLY